MLPGGPDVSFQQPVLDPKFGSSCHRINGSGYDLRGSEAGVKSEMVEWCKVTLGLIFHDAPCE